MPNNTEISYERMEELVSSGGLEDATLKRRKWIKASFESFLRDSTQVENLQAAMKSKEFEDHLMHYFGSLRVTKNGKSELPQKSYLDSIKSHLKCIILEESKSRINITVPSAFPNLTRLFKGVSKDLKAKGRGDTTHYAAMDRNAQEAIANLIMNLTNVLQLKGDEKYWDAIEKIPEQCRDSYHILVTYCCQYILTMFDCRRGREGLCDLKKSSFKLKEDPVSKVRFYQKEVGEKSKNHQADSENVSTGGVLFFDEEAGMNPGLFFHLYLKTLHPENDYLLQRARRSSKGFNIHMDTMMYETTRIGQNMIGGMLPNLCLILGLPRYPNHSIRSTVISSMKRSGYDDRTISLLSGHKNLANLSNYDPGLTVKEKFEIARSIDAKTPNCSTVTSTVQNSRVSVSSIGVPMGEQNALSLFNKQLDIIAHQNDTLKTVVMKILDKL